MLNLIPKIHNFTCVFFDFDMTLLDSKELINQAIFEILESEFPSHNWTPEVIKKENNSKRNLREVFDILLSQNGISKSYEDLEDLRIKHKEALKKQSTEGRFAPDIETTLDKIKNSGKIIGIISNNAVPNVINLLGSLNKYFDQSLIIGAEYHQGEIYLSPENYSEYKKPSPKMLEIVISQARLKNPELQIKPVLIGDDENDQLSVENYNKLYPDTQFKYILYAPFTEVREITEWKGLRL